MKIDDATKALAALGQETRLRVFRILIEAGPSGLPAGELARRLEVSPSTLSTHLSVLEAAGLLRATRIDRRILYAVSIEGVRRLLGFLTEDCCGGRPELCGDLVGEPLGEQAAEDISRA